MTWFFFRLSLVLPGLMAMVSAQAAQEIDSSIAWSNGITARAYSVEVMRRLAEPVLTALSENKLKDRLPIPEQEASRRSYAPLEAFGRLMAGMAPWLELGPDDTPEGQLRGRMIRLASQSLVHAVDPASPDFMNFTNGGQPLVDTAFLAQGLLRAPVQLWGNLPTEERPNLFAALRSTRQIRPGENNWLLFSAMVECALWKFSDEFQIEPIQRAVEKHLEWYKGDGTYGDGAEFHWDYYNSYVIQPMLLDVLRVCLEKHHPLGDNYPLILKRARRYAAIQERLISPEGTFPVMGRSSAYRFGAFQSLSQLALMRQLPTEVKPGTARAALTAVIARMLEAPGTFDSNGWLQTGTVGFQPSIRESYISTGSLYLCSVGLLHLGLLPNDPFWTDPPAAWTQKRIWAGDDVAADHALQEKR
jgi:hypothetical protein